MGARRRQDRPDGVPRRPESISSRLPGAASVSNMLMPTPGDRDGAVESSRCRREPSAFVVTSSGSRTRLREAHRAADAFPRMTVEPVREGIPQTGKEGVPASRDRRP